MRTDNIAEQLCREGIEINDAGRTAMASPERRGSYPESTPEIDPEELRLIEEIETIKAEQSAYQKSLGFLSEDAHARVDALVGSARDFFEGTFATAGSILDSPRHQSAALLVDSYVMSTPEFSKASHAAVDAATKAGAYNKTSRKTVEAKLAEFSRQIESRKLALERRAVAARAAQAAAALSEVDARAEKLRGA